MLFGTIRYYSVLFGKSLFVTIRYSLLFGKSLFVTIRYSLLFEKSLFVTIRYLSLFGKLLFVTILYFITTNSDTIRAILYFIIFYIRNSEYKIILYFTTLVLIAYMHLNMASCLVNPVQPN